MEKLLIRTEEERDHRIVEEITRDAFWNLYIPGCDEHYLVHVLRTSPDYLPALSFVAEWDGQIVGSIFFTKSYILDDQGTRHDMATFGPVSVTPELHNRGIGCALIRHAAGKAASLGYRAILIYGYPGYYQRFGFRHAKDFGISNPEGRFPAAHLALELYKGALDGITGKAYESDVYHVDQAAAQQYDAQFPSKVKMEMPSQETFQKMAASFL